MNDKATEIRNSLADIAELLPTLVKAVVSQAAVYDAEDAVIAAYFEGNEDQREALIRAEQSAKRNTANALNKLKRLGWVS